MPLALIALGSNLGDRSRAISAALGGLRRLGRVDRTASLYDSPPALLRRQPRFLNSVVALDTRLSPHALLQALQRVEAEGGRVFRQRYGPREIDCDLLLYDQLSITSESLDVPHPRIAERPFVLQPLAEIARDMETPLGRVGQLEAALGGARLPRVCPVGGGALWKWGERTRLMGVLNVTPDSFSDGREGEATEAAVERGLAMRAAGADVIDVGGQSTRPGAQLISASEELSRVAPVVRRLRERGLEGPISVDTFYASVAEQAVSCGATMVNDVSGGAYDPQMLPTVARLDVPVVLMHSRGTAQTMSQLASYADVTAETEMELAARVAAAEAAGIPRWNIIVDVGIGFAKKASHNLSLLRELPRFAHDAPQGPASSQRLGLPLLVGVSRKSFIGDLLGGAPPGQRGWGTAAACAVCIPHADILRVHDVAEMKQVALVADAIHRPVRDDDS